MPSAMRLTVNANPHEHRGDGTLRSLLDELGAGSRPVAILLNDRVIAREGRDEIALSENDTIEILTYAGGG